MHNPMKIAVAGATGRVGHHLVDVLNERGYAVVPISRSGGVDVVTADGLEAALAGVDAIVDATTGPSPEQEAATEFFETATRNLQKFGALAGVQRLVVVSIVGCDRFTGGYGAAKVAHERDAEAGPIPARVVRASQFHEFVGQLLDWGTQGDVAYVQHMQTQLVSARTVAETLADVVTGADGWPDAGASGPAPFVEVAGPRVEVLADMAKLLVARRGDPLAVEAVSRPEDPDDDLYASGALLPGPDAILGGPTYEEWLDATL